MSHQVFQTSGWPTWLQGQGYVAVCQSCIFLIVLFKTVLFKTEVATFFYLFISFKQMRKNTFFNNYLITCGLLLSVLYLLKYTVAIIQGCQLWHIWLLVFCSLSLKWDNLRKELEGFAAMASSCKGGRITIEEFASFLKLPVNPPLEQLFALFDRVRGLWKMKVKKCTIEKLILTFFLSTHSQCVGVCLSTVKNWPWHVINIMVDKNRNIQITESLTYYITAYLVYQWK